MSNRLLTGCVAAALLLGAQASLADEAQVFAGNNTNGPTWFRPIGGGPSISANNVHFRTQRFRLLNTADCYIYSAQSSFDGYLHLYRTSFNPASQLTNLVAGDDDGPLGIGTSILPTDPQDDSEAFTPINLTAATYILVTSGFSNGDVGAFQNTIHCNGTVQPLHGSCGIQFAGFNRNEEICLQDRFLVVIGNISNSVSGKATPVRTGSNDTGLFWFFSDNNWEVMVKVLNGCAINGHYWVFAGALTNQRYTISVADATTLQVNGYSNTLGVRSPAFADTQAFNCP